MMMTVCVVHLFTFFFQETLYKICADIGQEERGEITHDYYYYCYYYFYNYCCYSY